MSRTTRALLCLALAIPMSLGTTAALAQGQSPGTIFDQELPLTELDGTAVAPDAGITITFGSDGSLSGFGGCNHYSAQFQSDGTTLTIGPIAANLKACDLAVSDLEHQYLGLLQDAASWSLNGSAVEVVTSKGSTIVFGGETSTGGPTGEWTLTSIGGQPVPAGVEATATFDANGNLTGSGGCNTYSGTYTVDGSSLSVAPLSATLQFCADTSDTEHSFLSALQVADGWSVDGSTLTLTGTTDLVFNSGASTGTTPAGDWLLATMTGVNMLSFGITATFFDDGTVAGFGGCNQYHATWTVEGDTLTVGPIGSTKKACSTTVDDAETTYLGYLQHADGFTVVGPDLTITSGGNLLEFAAAGGPAPSPEATTPSPEATTPSPEATTPGAEPTAEASAGPGPSGGATRGIVGSWRMTEYAGQAMPGGLLDITITFAADGTFSGNGGCNDYQGSWTLAGTKLAMKDFQGGSGNACDSTTSSLEQGWFSLVPFLDTATVANGTLTLASAFASATSFVFEPAG